MGVCVEIDVDAVGIVGVGIVDGGVGIGAGISFGVSVYAAGGATGTETTDAGIAGAGATYVGSVGFVVSVGINSLVPHPVQNVASAVDLLPQFVQNIFTLLDNYCPCINIVMFILLFLFHFITCPILPNYTTISHWTATSLLINLSKG